MTAIDTIKRYLEEQGIEYEVLFHRETFTTTDEAKALGIVASHVAKTLIIKTGGGDVLAVLPASERIDLHKLRDITADNHARLATEDEMESEYGDFELGAVPPLGGLIGASVYLDQRLEKADEVIFAGGTHSNSIKVTGEDFLKLTHPEIGDLVEEEVIGL